MGCMPTQISRNELRRYALVGAEARLSAIANEAAAIYRVFPELRNRGRGSIPLVDRPAQDGAASPTKGRRSNRMSGAQRKAVSERMKKYWATRRGDTGDAKEPQGTEAGLSKDEAGDEAARPSSSLKQARQPRGAAKSSRGATRGSRRLSAAARKRISEAQKARWAKQKRTRSRAA